MSIIKRFLLLLFLLLALTTGAAAAGTITDLRTDCLVAGNGSCQVTQTVTIEFTGIEQSLTIPLGANAKRASIAGYRAQKTVEDGYTLFQLKDDAGFAGSRTFTVTYTLSGLVTETDGEQTLNLPLLCPKWDYPIEHFSFTVTMPKDIETVPGFSSGYYGDVIEDYMTAARQGAVLLGDLDTALKDHESLTMTLALGPRYFTGTYSGWSANWVAAAFCILFALLALGYWFVTLRSPRLSVSSRSLPPDSALPCDLPFLLAGAKPDFNMLLCHWASLGYLSITVDPQGHVSLLRHMYMGNERRGLECKLFAALFARADRCDGASIHYKNTAKSAAGALARFWGRRLYERGSGNVLVMRALAALCSGVALLSAASFLLPVLPLRWLVLVLCFVLGAAMMAFVLGRNKKKEGVLFGSLKGDPYAITEYKGDTKDEVPVKNKINIMCSIYPERYADTPEKDKKRKQENGAEKTEEFANAVENHGDETAQNADENDGDKEKITDNNEGNEGDKETKE